MKPIYRLLPLVLALLAGAVRPAAAEDIDIFTATPTVVGARPNVLVVLDSSSNWNGTFSVTPGGCTEASNTKFCHEVAALNSVLSGIGEDINVGVMLFAETGANGGYVRFAVRQMTSGAGGNQTALQNLLNNLSRQGAGSDNSGSNQPYGKVMLEAFKYFGGHTSPAAVSVALGTGGDGNPAAGSPRDSTHFGPTAFAGGPSNGNPKRDCPTNTSANSAAQRGADANAAFASCASTDNTYISPIDPLNGSCQKNYIIFISNGNPGTGGDSGAPNASTLLGNVGGNISTINPPNHASLADEWARFLYATDVSPLTGQQNVITYTIAVYDGTPSTQDQSMIDLMKSMANQGHGRYFDGNNPSKLRDALKTTFNEIQGVNSVFAAVALPVSVNVRGTNLNQVYLGVFRPDSSSLPRWPGNLKEYQLKVDAGNLILADQRNIRADNQTSGFIVDDAISFWTSPVPAPAPDPASGFWNFRSNNIGNPPSGFDSPDGATVEKGAVSQRLHVLFGTDQSPRKLYTCLACAPGTSLSTAGASTLLNTANTGITQSLVGAASATERDDIINWVRGADNTVPKENASPPAGQTIRPTIHGDVLHSRPAVINYGRVSGEDDIVVFYGSNDGLFRAVKGGKDVTPGPGLDVGGNEKWAFVAQEFLDGFKRQRDNTPAIGATAPNVPKRYFFDGSIGVHQSGSTVKLFLAMRRGGRMVYALDVSNPDAPIFLWKKGCPNLTNNTGCDPGWSEIGQTWSEPKVVSINAASNPVLIFGAGYDPSLEDQDPVLTPSVNPMGRGIFAVDSTDGHVIWQAGPSPSGATHNLTVSTMTYSIPSDVAALPTRSSTNRSIVDRVYVGDTGGNIWRVDLSDPSPANWTVNKLASVGDAANPGVVTARRKFLFSPDVVYATGSPPYDAVLIGSGDREHPFNGFGGTEHPLTDAVVNRYYMFKDESIGLSFTPRGSGTGSNAGALIEPPTPGAPDLFDTTDDLIQVGTAAQRTAAANSLAAAKGWFITLLTGEKVVTSSATVAGIVSFNTNRPTPPAPGVCTNNLGEARLYTVNYQTGAAIPPASGSVTPADRYSTQPGGGYPPTPVPVIVEIDGKKYEGVISGTTVKNPPTPKLEARYRTYWYKEMEKSKN